MLVLTSLFVGTVGLPAQPQNCDPLIESACAFPFPSNYWLDGDSCGRHEKCAYWLANPICIDANQPNVSAITAGVGVPCSPHVNLTNTLPLDIRGNGIDAAAGGWNDLDGFSSGSFLQVHFPSDELADSDISINRNSPRFWSIEQSTLETSSTVLLEADTGVLVPHWVELDHSFDGALPKRRALLIWPAARLKSGTRYVAAIRNLHNSQGVPVTPSGYFTSLRDGAQIGWRSEVYKNIFEVLAKAEVKRDSTLQLAWDFTVGSREKITGRLLSARDDAFARAPKGPQFFITNVVDNYNSHIARRIEGVMETPLYLNQRAPGTKSRLVLDEDDKPVYQGTMTASFEMLIPNSVVGEGAKNARVVQYGHGLFGDKSEVQTGYLSEDADQYGYILIASDWIGLAAFDEVDVALMLATNITNFAMVPDRCTQGVINALMLMRLMKGPDGGLLTDKTVRDINGSKVNVDGMSRSYFGNSQGGILGTLYMSVSTDVTRGLIGVGGAPYSLLLPRSEDFKDLGVVIELRYPDPLAEMTLLSAMQMLWDRAEPIGYVDGITENTFPNTPSHRVLFHYGLGDAQVSWLGCQTLARSTGSISMFSSNVREGNESFFGYNIVPDHVGISEGNAIVGFDFGAPTVPFINQPANKSTDAHEKPRRDHQAQDMMDIFFRTGEVVNTCGGPCRNITSIRNDAIPKTTRRNWGSKLLRDQLARK